MATPPWTIARVLDWTRKDFASRGLPSPRLDAEVLVAHALRLRRVDLYIRYEQPLNDAELASVRALVERRRRFEPVAYIVGTREFYARNFAVDARVLVPRPETEGLIEAVLAALPPVQEGIRRRALDIGTGSGAIAVTLAAERPDLDVDAVDLSPDAAAVARDNAARNGVAARVRVLEGPLYGPVGGARYDAVASNPPYIPSGEIAGLMADVRDHEPHLALDGGARGDDVLRPLIAQAREHLVAGGVFAVELHYDQAERVRALAQAAGLVRIELRKDLAGIDRVLVAFAPEP